MIMNKNLAVLSFSFLELTVRKLESIKDEVISQSQLASIIKSSHLRVQMQTIDMNPPPPSHDMIMLTATPVELAGQILFPKT